ncbi:Transcriptional regulator, MarR family [Grimontia indica]|uniref:Organic hydroperoxide resistance transcriptional regulator n=2 Tax=Grimontia TaxID=246861 RepID=A0A128F8C2_9GAMM|nr:MULTISPECIES: MarR family winged helix-turn-helix transcriptional regulator [Grimontia]EOD79603.1 Transcriptional regulator, MarR family [Grimontia indica]CZF82745.1 Organic hydroperoxide resistance transcriptional regulator [Grimontia marina]
MTQKKHRTLMLNQFLPYRMVNLADGISNACSKIYREEFDVSIPEWRILARLAEHEKLNAKDIGDLTFMDKSRVSRAVKLLEEKGLLLKVKDSTDNRASFLSLSESGRDLYAKIAPKALDWEAELIDVLDTVEYRDFLRVMEKLDARLEQMKG